MSTPPLPAGYALDATPPLPAGYALDSGAPAEQPSTYSKLTAGYNQGAEDFAQKHPIFGPMVRFLDAAGGAAMSTPEGIYQALSHPSDTAKGALESLAAWKDPAVRKAALSVLPEALGQGVGNVAGGEAAGAAGGAAASAVPSAADIGRLLRDPATGKLKTIPREAARVAGVAAGHALYPGEGGIVGAFVGPKIADALIPSVEPNVAKAVPLSQSPNYPKLQAARRAAIAEAKASNAPPVAPEPSPIISPDSSVAPESEGRPATWRNLTVSELARQGGPLSFDAAKQAQLRQLGVPDVGLVADPRATFGATSIGSSAERLARLRELAYPQLAGGPGDFAKAGEPDFAYRVRQAGEEGVPLRNSHAHATTSLDEANDVIQPGLEGLPENEGKSMQTIKYDLSKLKEGTDYVRVPREGKPDWIKMLRPLKESEVQPVTTQ